MKKIAEHLVKTGCYIRTVDSKFDTTHGDQVLAYLCCRLAISNVEVREKIIEETYNAGITKFVCAGYNIQSSLKSLELAISIRFSRISNILNS